MRSLAAAGEQALRTHDTGHRTEDRGRRTNQAGNQVNQTNNSFALVCEYATRFVYQFLALWPTALALPLSHAFELHLHWLLAQRLDICVNLIAT